MAIRRFEEIVSWQKARDLVRQVYGLGATSSLRHDPAIRPQMERAAVSCACNIAEGFGRNSNLEFRNHLRYAAASAREVQSCLYNAVDCGLIGGQQFTVVYELADRVAAACNGFAAYLKKTHATREGKAG